jgi:hypothetical protein
VKIETHSVIVGDKYRRKGFRVLHDVAEWWDDEKGRWIRSKGQKRYLASYHEWPRSDLANCEVCGRLIGKRFIRYGWVSGVNYKDKDDQASFYADACIACIAKMHRINQQVKEYVECRVLIGHIKKELENGRKT